MNFCKYCGNPHKNIINIVVGEYEDGDPRIMHVDTDGQFIRAYDNSFCNPTIQKAKVNYCHMCGRKF